MHDEKGDDDWEHMKKGGASDGGKPSGKWYRRKRRLKEKNVANTFVRCDNKRTVRKWQKKQRRKMQATSEMR